MATADSQEHYRKEIFRPLLLAVSVLILAVLWLFQINYRLIQLNEDHVRVEEARLVLERFTRAMVDAETGQRGYLLTNNPTFLGPYNGAYAQAVSSLVSLQQLSRDFPDIAQLQPRLRFLVDRKFASIEASFKIQLNAGAYAPHLHITKDAGQAIMHEIRTITSDAERALLQEKRSIENRIRNYLTQIVVGASLVVIVISTILLFGYRRIVYLFEHAAEMQNRAHALQQQVMLDALTKIPNRRGFEECVQNHFALAQRTGMPFSILYLDLDGFKAINDEQGHEAGDQALIAAANRFKATMRDSDVIARLGGDEFALVAHNAGDREQLLVLAQRLIAALEQPIDLSGGEVKLGVSIGIASYPGNGNSIEDLLAAADAAMYEAKHRGKNRACFSENPISGRQTNG
jgi:diguanylate cyclase (GGDEF)-like protein